MSSFIRSFDFKSNTFDIDLLSRLREEEARIDDDNLNERKRKKNKFSSRKTKIRKDPKNSGWWFDYVLDVNGLYTNPEDDNYNLFRYRFQLPRLYIMELATEMNHLHPNQKDAFNRPAVPIELLILGIYLYI